MPEQCGEFALLLSLDLKFALHKKHYFYTHCKTSSYLTNI